MTRQVEVEGVPTLLAPTNGTLHAGLAFRVGTADEGLPRRGITHLVEHLALNPVGVADYHYNGATTARYTYVHMEGSPTEVVEFLNGVCAALRSLPTARLAAEKEILRTEAQGRGGSVRGSLDLWRYGASGYGATAYPEWGVDAVTPDDLRAWVARYFTAQNAALWIAADEVPAGLELGLPQGVRRPLPAVTSALPVRPAWFTGDDGGVAWDAVVPHGVATGVFSGVLQRVLRRALRHEAGLSYQVSTDREVLGDGTDLLTAYADALPEKQGAVLGGMVDVLAALRVGRVDEADLVSVVESTVESYEQADRVAGQLPGQAIGLLLDRPVLGTDEVARELRAVTTADVAAVARAAWSDGLAMVPPGPGASWAGLTPAPVASFVVVEDGADLPESGNPTRRLRVSGTGVSVVRQDAPTATVLFRDCVAVLAWPDGGRRLIGSDGISVVVEPTLHPEVDWLVEHVDRSVPPGVRIDRPARDADEIPQPRPVAPSTVPPDPTRMGRGRGAALLALLVPVFVAGAFVVLVGIVALASEEDRVVVFDVLTILVGLFVLASGGWFARRVIRRMTR